jgi:hypothetical protein
MNHSKQTMKLLLMVCRGPIPKLGEMTSSHFAYFGTATTRAVVVAVAAAAQVHSVYDRIGIVFFVRE